ncbi:MAG: TonB-dependent receptor [Pseudomonadota bacterium]
MSALSTPVRRALILFTLGISGLLSIGTAAAQETTSAMRVIITDETGGNVSGVSVQIRHVPTGRVQTLTSNASGIVIARGLVVGGPYEVKVTNSTRYAADEIRGISLELDKTEIVDLIVRPIVEELVVTAKGVTEDIAVGIGAGFNRATIDATPSVSRDFVSTLARDPKILVDNSVARGPAVSLAGANFRFNSVTIDGIPQNDNFGLSKNASATQRSPISIDAIEAINVNIAPYDVTYGNFIGGNINIVTKSGTNEFTGSAFYLSTDDSLTGDRSDDVDIDLGNFDEEVFGFTLGGPIIRDRLFFFANYEKFETTRPTNSQPIVAIAGVSQADVDRVRSILQNEYGFDPGLFAGSDVDEDEKILLKLDWNINDDHRAVFAYQVADGDVAFDDFPTVAALQSNRYNINEKLTAYSAQLFSYWGDNLTTEIKFGTKEVENRQISFNTNTPAFSVDTDAGGTILAGGDQFRHSNELDNESDVFRIKADYVVGNNVITAGWERESKTVRNRFLPFSKGQFVFGSIDNLEARIPDFVLYGNSNTGIATDAEAAFTLDTDSFFIQNEWTPRDDVTVTYGLRYDTLSNDDPITDNPNFLARRGFTNGENLDGKDLLMPRLGLNWDINDRLTLRGGAGLFGGGAPLIILSNSYAGDGISRTFASFLPGPGFGANIPEVLAAVAALPDPNAAFNNLQPLIGVNPVGQTDALSPDFEILATWKYSLGLDYVADLSALNLGDDWQLSAELIYSDVENGYDIFEARRSVVDTAPDGRPIYDLPADADYITTSTSAGSGTVYTLKAQKTFDTQYGIIDLNIGYTNQDIEELRSYNRFVTFETLSFDPSTDLNNPGLAPSRFEVEHRYTAQLTWENTLFGDNRTLAGLVYQGRSGRHYSYVFGSNGIPTFGGNFLADFGSEGDNIGNQLFYVPTGVSDPIVTGDAQFLADLDQFVADTPCLAGNRGAIVGRNNCRTGWVNQVNLRLAQEVKLRNDFSFDLTLDIENLGNLLNENWGRVDSYTAPSNVAPAAVALSGDGSQYVLSALPGYVAGDPSSLVPSPEIAQLPSVYRIQFGVTFRF